MKSLKERLAYREKTRKEEYEAQDAQDKALLEDQKELAKDIEKAAKDEKK